MTRTRVKICGITNSADAGDAVACGADALGFMFNPVSARYLTIEEGATIVREVPAFVTRVGVFADADEDTVLTTLQDVPLDVLQFHGGESPEYCESFGMPYMKVIAGTSAVQIEETAARYRSASAILLDTATKGQFGGTGETFDWSVVPALPQPVVLAGGISADNVARAITTVRPWAVDLCTGVEREKRFKDVGKMRALMAAIAKADAERK